MRRTGADDGGDAQEVRAEGQHRRYRDQGRSPLNRTESAHSLDDEERPVVLFNVATGEMRC
jgi:hypothetical protein